MKSVSASTLMLRGFIDEDDGFLRVGFDLLELFVAEAQVTTLRSVHEHADMGVTAHDFVVPFHSYLENSPMEATSLRVSPWSVCVFSFMVFWFCYLREFAGH